MAGFTSEPKGVVRLCEANKVLTNGNPLAKPFWVGLEKGDEGKQGSRDAPQLEDLGRTLCSAII